jgi:hypothetical protein
MATNTQTIEDGCYITNHEYVPMNDSWIISQNNIKRRHCFFVSSFYVASYI